MEPTKLFAVDVPTLVVTIVGTALASGLAAYFGAYLGEKAKHVAMREDFKDLVAQQRETTHALESIRVAVSGDMWVARERWKLKRENYSALLKALTELRNILSHPDTGRKELGATSARMDALMDEITLNQALAALWLGADALRALEDMASEMRARGDAADAKDALAQHVKALNRALRLLVDAARKDFKFEILGTQ
jgi:hypothetical protein